jgi:hypothetical protein
MLAAQVLDLDNRIELDQRSLIELILHECQLSPFRGGWGRGRLFIVFCFFSVRPLGVLLYTAIYCSSPTIDFDEGDS